MNCQRCGNVLNPTDNVCPNCGLPVAQPPQSNLVNQGNGQYMNELNNSMQQPMNSNPMMNGPMQQPMNSNPMMNGPIQQPMNSNPMMNNNTQINQQATQMPNQPINDVYNQGSTQKPKKNGVVIVIIIILLLAIAGGALYFVFGNKQNNNPNNTVENVNGGGGSSVEPVDNGSNVYLYKDYEFPVPNGYQAMLEDDFLVFVDQSNRVAVLTAVLPVSYQQLITYQDDLKQEAINSGMNVNNITEETHGNTKWVKMSFTYENEVFDYYYTSLDSYYTAQIMIYNEGKIKDDEQILNEFANAFANTKYKGTSGFSGESNDKVDIKIDKFDGDYSSLLN